MPSHVIHYTGSMSPAGTEQIRNTTLVALQQGATEIDLRLSSWGGNNHCGFALYTFLRTLPVPLTVHNVGRVESIAVPVFLAGSRRAAAPYTRFLIHPMSWTINGLVSIDHARMREYVEILDNDLQTYIGIFLERTKGSAQVLDVSKHLLSRDLIIDAADAVGFGLIHAVQEATLSSDAVHWRLVGD